MEPIENQLFDLIESTDFNQLTVEQKAFVNSHLSEKEYRQQRLIIASTNDLEYEKIVPLPLAIPAKKKSVLVAPIPLYKVLIGSAAALALILYLWPKDVQNTETLYVKGPSVTDTVFQIQTLIDTIIIEEEKIVKLAVNKMPDTVYVYEEPESYSKRTTNRKLNASQPIPLPELNASELKNKGTTMKEDNFAGLLPDLGGFQN